METRTYRIKHKMSTLPKTLIKVGTTEQLLFGMQEGEIGYSVTDSIVYVKLGYSLYPASKGGDGGWREALNKETDERKTADSDLKKSIEKSESDIGNLGRQINEETTRATESEKANADAIESVANRLDSEFETKADAKSKSETYGLLMRENGKNTLQFYRPSLG